MKNLETLTKNNPLLAPEFVAKELIKILPPDTAKILAQKPAKNTFQFEFNKLFLMKSAREGNMEEVFNKLSTLIPFSKDTPTLFRDLERALGDKRMQFIDYTIDKELAAPDQSQLFRGAAMKFALSLSQAEVESQIKLNKQQDTQDTTEPYINNIIENVLKTSIEELPITQAIFTSIYKKTAAKKGATQASILTFNAFSLRIFGNIAMGKAKNPENGTQMSNICMKVAMQQSYSKGTVPTVKGKRETEREKLADKAASTIWETKGKDLENFVERLSRQSSSS
jgi:hypothetical protein